MKVIIAGGVAAGASAAARLRRLDESAEIILLEKGAFISYANCGLPYHLGGVSKRGFLQEISAHARATNSRTLRISHNFVLYKLESSAENSYNPLKSFAVLPD